MKVENKTKDQEVTLEVTLTKGQWRTLVSDLVDLGEPQPRTPQPKWLVQDLPNRIAEAL
jgi:hypothetical protein